MKTMMSETPLKCGMNVGAVVRGGLGLAIALSICGSTARAEDRIGSGRRILEGKPARIAQILEEVRTGHGETEEETGGRACVELTEMSVMFDAGLGEDEIEAALQAMPDAQFGAFLAQGSRWTSTATNGAVSQGQRMTITYSFIPDGTLIQYLGNSEGSSLHLQFDQVYPGGSAAWKAKMRQAFTRWSQLLNINYVEVGDDGALFPSSTGVLGLRGDVRIGMRTLGEPLAVNYYPQFGGDMILDSEDIQDFVNEINDYRTLRNVLMHEHGHGLGLNHVLPVSSTKLMEPFLAIAFDGPQEDDIRGAQSIYGDAREQNDTPATNAFVGGTLQAPATNPGQTFKVEDASIERAGSADFYGFTAFAGVPIAIRVDPVGTTYEFGAQNTTTTTTVDAKSVRDLDLRLWRRTSAANNTFELLAQIDFNGAGEGEYHPPIIYTIAGFMVAEVYSSDGQSGCQRYELTISNQDIVAPEEQPSMSVYNVAAQQQITDGTTIQFGQVNLGSNQAITLTIVNGGPGTLEIGDLELAGPGAADFLTNLIGNPVDADDQASLVVSFVPTAEGVRQAVLTIPNNDLSQPDFSVILSGTGFRPPAPVAEVTIGGVDVLHNSTLDFGSIETGRTAEFDVIIANVGNANLNISNISLIGTGSADYQVSATNLVVAPGATGSLTLSVTPSIEGVRTVKMRLFNNGVNNPFLVDLSATGVAPLSAEDDCNGNGTLDSEDVASGASSDCNSNGTPDACEVDSDGDGTIDDCEVDVAPDENGDDTNAGDDDRGQNEDDGEVDPFDTLAGGGLCGGGGSASMTMSIAGLCGIGAAVRGGRRRSRR